jgi:hypothetical protein
MKNLINSNLFLIAVLILAVSFYTIESKECKLKYTGQVLHDSYSVLHILLSFSHKKIDIGDTLFYVVKSDSTIACHANNTWVKRTY